MRNDDTQTLAVAVRESESETARGHEGETIATDDFFSDAPLDVESAVTGKTCNIFDPDCEACQ